SATILALNDTTKNGVPKELLEAAMMLVNFDGNMALDKKATGAINCIALGLEKTLGSKGQFDSSKFGKLLSILETVAPKNDVQKALVFVMKTVLQGAIATGLTYRPTPMLAGFKDMTDEQYETCLKEKYVSYFMAGNGETVELPKRKTSRKIERRNIDLASACIFKLVSNEDELEEGFFPYVLLPRDVVERKIKEGTLERETLSNFRIGRSDQYKDLDIVPVAKNPVMENDSFANTLQEDGIVISKPIGENRWELEPGWDLFTFSSPNRDNSKAYRSVEGQTVLVNHEPVYMSKKACDINPFAFAGKGAGRPSGYMFARNGLLSDRTIDVRLKYKWNGSLCQEDQGNLGLVLFVPKDSEFGDICLEGDAVVLTGHSSIKYGKFDFYQKSKGMGYYIPEIKPEIEFDGQVLKPEFLVNQQGKRGNQAAVIGSSCARLMKYLGHRVPSVPSQDIGKMEQMAKRYMEKCRVIWDGKVCYIGLGKFAYDTSQNYLPQANKDFTGGYYQALELMLISGILNGVVNGTKTFTFEQFKKLPVSYENRNIVLVAAHNFREYRRMAEAFENFRGIVDVKRAYAEFNMDQRRGYGTKVFKEYLILSGKMGSQVQKIHAIFRSGCLDRLEELNRLAENIEVKLGNETFTFKFPNSFLDQEDMLIRSLDLQVFFRFLKAGFGFVYSNETINEETGKPHKEEKLNDLRDITKQACRSAFDSAKEAGVHHRGQAISGRSFTGRKGVNEAFIPKWGILKFFGYIPNSPGEQIKRVSLKDDPQLSLRIKQAPELNKIVSLCVAIYNSSPEEYNLTDEINKRIGNIECLLCRHPILGALPLVHFKVKEHLAGIIVPFALTDRYFSMNSDDDGDIVYFVPIEQNFKVDESRVGKRPDLLEALRKL
ncbi:MAG TPA: hypothetical protein PK821_04915, partial [Victivallales bacterium]|nr:hypothetical protein [Victivallales bacterium]